MLLYSREDRDLLASTIDHQHRKSCWIKSFQEVGASRAEEFYMGKLWRKIFEDEIQMNAYRMHIRINVNYHIYKLVLLLRFSNKIGSQHPIESTERWKRILDQLYLVLFIFLEKFIIFVIQIFIRVRIIPGAFLPCILSFLIWSTKSFLSHGLLLEFPLCTHSRSKVFELSNQFGFFVVSLDTLRTSIACFRPLSDLWHHSARGAALLGSHSEFYILVIQSFLFILLAL
mmetsp:Transcript_21757/g.32382  ORF Transcript_21757/g.32382 Transcript_21757/m.32382 type:complete len:229 (+) Transcript_21757:138-824(+)